MGEDHGVSRAQYDDAVHRSSNHRRAIAVAGLTSCLAAALAGPAMAAASPARVPSPPSPPSEAPAHSRPDPTSARDEEQRLPRGWRTSEDRLWTARGDRDGLHLLAADLGDGYSWRTVATLREPGFETSSWVGNTCLTTSGRYVVATYAPREFTNHEDSFLRGAFTAVVDLESGDVRRLPIRSTMAYHNPGCGHGEEAVIAQQRSGENADTGAATRLFRVDAASGEVSAPVTIPGQVTSAIPTRAGIVAAAGRSVVAVEPSGSVRVLAPAATVPADLTLDARGDVLYVVGTQVLGDVDDDMGRNGCHRSPFAWSRKALLKDSTSTLGQRADSWDNQLDFQLHACSGAQTENILPYYTVPAGQAKPKNLFDQEGRGQFGEMSQMDKGYLDENTTLVTISMGGNDARFSDIVKECIYAAGLQSCPDTELSGESEDMDVQVPADINSVVRRSIEVTVVEIAKRAPNAKIVLMGYPKLLEFSGACIPGINPDEGDWMNDMGGVMDDMFVNLVGTSQYGLKAAGYKVWYSSPVDEFAGEAICGDPETIHGIVLDKTESDPGGLNPTSAQSFHPKIPGTDHYRDALQATLREPDLALGN
jgi:hypothetical protein